MVYFILCVFYHNLKKSNRIKQHFSCGDKETVEGDTLFATRT